MTKHERSDWKKNRGVIGDALIRLFPVKSEDMDHKSNILKNHYLKQNDAEWFGHESMPLVLVYYPFVEAHVY